MSLSGVLEQIKKLQGHATENMEDGPLTTLAARRGRQRQAVEMLKYHREDYIKELQKNCMFVIAVGSNNNEFAKLAKDEFFSFSVDPETIYNELANKIPKLIYEGKSTSSNLFDVLGRHIEDKANELNLSEYNYVIMKQKYIKPIHNKEDLAQLIKLAVNEQIGSEIVGIHALRYITKEALERDHKSSVTAIILPTNDEKFATDLSKSLKRLSKKVHVVVAGKSTKTAKSIPGAVVLKEVDSESVKQLLKSLK